MLPSRLAIPLLLLLTASAHAGETAWQEVLPDVRMRLVAMPYFGADHDIAAAIEIDMPASHKTYWRISGDSGFPAQIDASDSRSLEGFVQMWPLPTIESFGGETDYVYRGRSFLPFSMKPHAGGEPVLEVSAFIGICSDICMPVQIDFSLPLDDRSPESMIAFADALSRIPAAWPFETSPIQSARIENGGISLRIDPELGIDARSIVASSAAGPSTYGVPVPTGDGVDIPLVGGGPPPPGSTLSVAFGSDSGIYVFDAEVE